MTARSSSSAPLVAGGSRADRSALAIIVLGAVALRLLYVGQPMRNDEAYSYLTFALPSLRTAVSDYTVPNNHVFHTVLVWLSTRLLGDSPEAIRAPVFVAGVVAVPVAALAARALADRAAGLFAAAAVAALPALVLYSSNARAYMLLSLATLLLVLLAQRQLDEEVPSRWAAIVVIGALGMWAAPVMLYPLAAVAAWLVAEHARTGGVRAALRFTPRIGAVGAAIAALAIALYLPVILREGLSPLARNRFVTPLAWPELGARLALFARGMRELIGLGLSRVEIGLAAIVGLLGVAAPGEQRARRVTLAAATVVACGALMLLTRRLPPPRALLFLGPLCCLYLGIGLAWLAARLHPRTAWVQAAGAVLVFVLLAAQGVRSRAVLRSEETDWIGMRDARDLAVLVLAGRPDDRVVINRSSGPPLDYYLHRRSGRRLSDFSGAERGGRVLVIVDDRHGQTVDRVRRLHTEVPWTSLEAPTLLRRFPGATVYAFAREAP